MHILDNLSMFPQESMKATKISKNATFAKKKRMKQRKMQIFKNLVPFLCCLYLVKVWDHDQIFGIKFKNVQFVGQKKKEKYTKRLKKFKKNSTGKFIKKKRSADWPNNWGSSDLGGGATLLPPLMYNC